MPLRPAARTLPCFGKSHDSARQRCRRALKGRASPHCRSSDGRWTASVPDVSGLRPVSIARRIFSCRAAARCDAAWGVGCSAWARSNATDFCTSGDAAMRETSPRPYQSQRRRAHESSHSQSDQLWQFVRVMTPSRSAKALRILALEDQTVARSAKIRFDHSVAAVGAPSNSICSIRTWS